MHNIKHSDIKELISELKIKKRIEELGNILNQEYKNEEVYVICVLKGSITFTSDLIRELKFPVKLECIRVSSYGNSTTTSGEVHAIDTTLPNLNNKNVLILEDIIDTGITAKFLINYMNSQYKTKSLKFVSLLNKKIKRIVEVDADYYGFEIDDKFVIGYGLDYDGLFRNLKFIGYVDNLV